MQQNVRLMVEGLIALLLLVLVGQGISTSGNTLIDDSYQAVFLDDGQIFFGKLEKLDTQWPVLRDVYFVQQRGVNAEGKKEQTIIKRSMALYQPSHMVINADKIRLIEPVSDRSKMYQLLHAAGQKKAEMLDDILKNLDKDN